MCHQTVSLVARQLESNGIATVVLGSAKDIMEYCGAPRFVFTDFPLGNPCGKPHDTNSQQQIMTTALELLSTAERPGQYTNSNLSWNENSNWKRNYMYVGPENTTALRLAGEERRKKREELRNQTDK